MTPCDDSESKVVTAVGPDCSISSPFRWPERLYYVQNRGGCGDCLIWWRADRCGYTMNLAEALKVTAAEAATFTRNEDRPWLASEVDAVAERHVNSQHMGTAKFGIVSEAKPDSGVVDR